MNIKIYQGKTLILSKNFDSFPVIIGRSTQCHLSVPDLAIISRTHASVSIENQRLVVTDLNSTNGIYADNERCQRIESHISPKSRQAALRFEVCILEKANVEKLVIDIFLQYNETQQDIDSQPTMIASDILDKALPKTRQHIESDPLKLKLDNRSAAQKLKASVDSPLSIEDDNELSHGVELTQVSSRLNKAAKKIRIEQDYNLLKLKKHDIGLQGVLTWGEEILDVRQFLPGDELIVGSNPYEPIYIPSITQRMKFGVYAKDQAKIAIPKNIKWRLAHKEYDYSSQEALQNKLASEGPLSHNINLDLTDTCSIDLGMNISLHLRYVQIPRPLVSRAWIENREEFKKAITISAAIHFIVVLIALVSTPKIEAPVVENLPPRYAKLLVEPPPQILVPEPVKPPPPPPPPPVVKKPVEMPRPIVQKAKPIAKPIVKTEKKSDAKPIAKKTESKPAENTKVNSNPAPEPKVPSAQEIAEQEAQAAADSFANAFEDAAPATASSVSNVNIVSKGSTNSGIKTSGLVGSIKVNNAQSGNSMGTGGNALAKAAGDAAYAKSSGKAGKRGVGGAVVGTPSFDAPSSPQGLSNDQVMSVVNKYLSDIQRCYERALFQDSSLAGRVEYEWEITAKGSVSRTSVKRSEISNGEFLNTCVLAIFKKMKFPEATNKQTTVANIGFPFGKN